MGGRHLHVTHNGLLFSLLADRTNNHALCRYSRLYRCTQKLGNASWTLTMETEVDIIPMVKETMQILFLVYLVVHSGIHLHGMVSKADGT